MKKWLLGFCILLILCLPIGAMTITPMDSAENLVQSLIGSGITISNVSYTGSNKASGYFTGGANLGTGFFDSGIVLTTGSVSKINRTKNWSDFLTGINFVPGSKQLDALIPGERTYDATVLSFDFVSNGDSVHFNFFFGSEEYNEYVNEGYNDVFGFWFEGKNVALIPGTSTPVSIDNINNFSNSSYYNDNDPSDTATPFPFEYDGFTNVFTAELNGLTPGKTYHIEMSIADTGDYLLDSGVFLQAESFTPDNPDDDVPDDDVPDDDVPPDDDIPY